MHLPDQIVQSLSSPAFSKYFHGNDCDYLKESEWFCRTKRPLLANHIHTRLRETTFIRKLYAPLTCKKTVIDNF